MESYCQEHKAEIKAYYQEHREEILARAKKYYREHREEVKKYRQEHKKEAKKYRQEHREEAKEYQKKRRKERHYKKQGNFLKEKLEEFGENQSWLAGQLGVTREAVSKYIKGVYFPREIGRRKKLCRTLKIKYSDLEKILSEN